MTRTWLGTVIPVAILLLSTLSCALFKNDVKPTQVVDFPAMLGKSLQEMTAMHGPASSGQGICYGWNLPEGGLSVCYKSGDTAKNSIDAISYSFPPPTLLAPRMAAGSPEEMAALINIDLQGKKPDVEFQGGYTYHDLNLNGRTADVTFDGGPKTIVGVRVRVKSSPAPPATNDPQTNTSIPASTAGVTMANYNRLQTGMTYAEVVKILGSEGKRESVMEAGGIKIEMYKWAGAEDGSDARLDAFFKNGKLDKKSQFALK